MDEYLQDLIYPITDVMEVLKTNPLVVRMEKTEQITNVLKRYEIAKVILYTHPIIFKQHFIHFLVMNDYLMIDFFEFVQAQEPTFDGHMAFDYIYPGPSEHH